MKSLSLVCRRVSTIPPAASTRCLRRTNIRLFSSQLENARLNIPTDFATTPLLFQTSQSALKNPELTPEVRNGTTKRMNLFQSINDALSTALASDESVLLFGEY